MISTFTFNGKNSADFGIYIESFPIENGGERIIESVEIPGRTRALTIDTGAYSNVAKTYSIMFRKYGDATQRMREIREWFTSAKGYCRLEDSYDPEIYRMARIQSIPSFENFKNDYGRAEITFDCDPRRFLKVGENAVPLASIFNSWEECKPIIKIINPTEGVLTFYGDDFSTTVEYENYSSTPGYVIIDCEKKTFEQSYDGVLEYGVWVDFGGDYPKLTHGMNTITMSSSDAITIVPNYWMP